ncbi:putative F-box/LRR-repeat protein At3g18150 isoform X2 [Eutrema salsugineum]|uniref:putative F-box/LRR-repeat protein At3g18150 isoform X2 n=1 Tax=Eutrema salsugineum TaxID=72664 RepID=UPI000CED78C9|nr:putative F-box/LRR-repeat protein At3g18150 isoform X2 [Eutrema salsugineum]
MAGDGATAVVEGGRDSSEDLDSISSLPDEILQQILSFIQTEEAIRTSVLSRRWRHVWSARYTAPKMTSFYIDTEILSNLTHIHWWLELAMSRDTENLTLDLGCYCHHSEDNYSLPDFFYTNSSVKQLSLHLEFNDLIPRCSVSWTSLKKLSLIACNLSDEALAKILSGCPILESLTLESCREFMVLDLTKSPRVRVLEFSPETWSPQSVEIVEIVAPHLHYLILENTQLPCSLVDVSSLIEAKLDIYFSAYNELLKADFLQVMALEQLDKLQNVEKLTLCENFLKILSLADLRSVLFPMFKAKVLTLETTISPYVIFGLAAVLEHSPVLKKLTLIHKRVRHFIPEQDIDKYLGPHGLRLLHPHSFMGSWSENHEVQSNEVASFMKLMLGSTHRLEKMVVRLEGCLERRGFEELLQIVPMLSHDSNVSIAVS